jgi:hypothetical protein
MGIAALTPWGAAVYGPAAAQFKAAALFGVVAALAGAAGRAIAGNSFSQGSGTGAGAGAGGEASNQNTNSVFVRGASSNLNVSSGNQTRDNELSAMRATLQDLSDSMRTFKTARPGEILQQGVREERGLVSQTLIQEIGTDHDLMERTQRRLSLI